MKSIRKKIFAGLMACTMLATSVPAWAATAGVAEADSDSAVAGGYTDVSGADWFYEGVSYVSDKGLMAGTGGGAFNPSGVSTRAQVLTIIHRMEGEPYVNYAMNFKDVSESDWYAEAIRFAASEKLISGYSDGRVGANDQITREQLAAILYRYAQSQGQGMQGAWAFRLDYADADQMADYAYEPFCWMIVNGIITGDSANNLKPKALTTRAELAQILMRFDKVMKEDQPVHYSDGVVKRMADADYWADRVKDADEVMMTAMEIDMFNDAVVADKNTYTYDLTAIDETYDGVKLRQSLAASLKEDAAKDVYFENGQQVDKTAYFDAAGKNILDGPASSSDKIKYGICTKRTEIRWCPVDGYVGYSAGDTDNEVVNSAIRVNDPFVIKAVTADGRYYWGYTHNMTGWIASEDVAICSDRDEWLDAWQTSAASKNILVITEDRFVTESSFYEPDISGRELTLGTVLKLADRSELNTADGRKDSINTYCVYLPVRKSDGSYEKKAALISQHNSVSLGYLPMTQRNLAEVALSCLGNRYGWGGSLDAMDCSSYVESVYRCFGIYLPRNTSWQALVPGKVDISSMNDQEKASYISTLPVGTPLTFKGHTMMYLGKVGSKLYVISALGSYFLPGQTTVSTINTVSINTLDVTRRNGTSWLTNLHTAEVIFGSSKA